VSPDSGRPGRNDSVPIVTRRALGLAVVPAVMFVAILVTTGADNGRQHGVVGPMKGMASHS
jgi:hypothetical protein